MRCTAPAAVRALGWQYGASLTYPAVGMVVEILTDNLNRAAMLVRSAVTKAGGKMADPGSVLFNFKRVGICVLTGGDEDTVFAAATDAGADDVQPRPGGEAGWEVITPADAYGAVAAALREAGLPMDADLSGQRLMPLMRVEVSDDEAAETNDLIVEKLLELDDVDAVVSNQAEDVE
jgi:transcriptional/translational regulatory protein YebC/TACO1